MEEQPIVKKTTTYTDAQKRATKKYRENNKDKVNEQRKKYYQNRKDKDPNFLSYKRQKAKEYYAKRKEEGKNKVKEVIELVKAQIKEDTTEVVKPTIIEEVKTNFCGEVKPTIIEEIKVDKKPKRTKKNKSV